MALEGVPCLPQATPEILAFGGTEIQQVNSHLGHRSQGQRRVWES